ncbi:GNAT family N-acetyltransferase, partial [Pantoea agglomerans]|uniref:GNAT family N-acetyltransferase n=1 Tax=Enterobacter agglomerans TaxID=549 RepID=UPI00177F2AF3
EETVAIRSANHLKVRFIQQSRSTQPLCYLEDLFIEEDMRGLGAGKMLIEAICEEGREKGWSKVYWVTREGNTARALYDKLALLDDFVRYSVKI